MKKIIICFSAVLVFVVAVVCGSQITKKYINSKSKYDI